MPELPSQPAQRALVLQNLLLLRAAGSEVDGAAYREIRREFMQHPVTRGLLPEFVRASHNLAAFWAWIRTRESAYAERRRLLYEGFRPLIAYLREEAAASEGLRLAKADLSLDVEYARDAWARALDRRRDDPQGAIAAARTLLETACRRVLDGKSAQNPGADKLSRLYELAADNPSIVDGRPTEDSFKIILDGCRSIVRGLEAVEDRLAAADRPSENSTELSAAQRALIIDLAGAIATFLLEGVGERAKPPSAP
jgi:hypothetical protein